MELEAVRGGDPHHDVVESQVAPASLYGHAHHLVIVQTEAFGIRRAHVDVAQGAHDTSLETQPPARALDQDPGGLFQLSRQPQRRTQTQHQLVGARDFDLILGSGWSEHPHVGQSTEGTDQGNRLLAGKLTGLGECVARLQAVPCPEQRIDRPL